MLRRLLSVNRLPARRAFSRRVYPGDKILIPTEPENSKVGDASSGHRQEFDKKTILQLESLSMCRFDDEQAVALLGEVVRKAERLQEVDVQDKKMMFTVWEQHDCPLMDDEPKDDLPLKKVMSNAARSQDDYFVSPPGNIALEDTGALDLDLINQWDKIGSRQAPLPKKVELKS
ncbi:unnamed protein product [Nippostrongylus brasiliensis]|uniref:Glu-AdT subunit C n=1 Tax=Nippostrongylus brasiliensis TaxID=27835 RepID=A0A0N4YRP1_NIPBR|nr:unnamed protein product [Nippostrongylus brasiliensis]